MRDCFICGCHTRVKKVLFNIELDMVQCLKCGLIFDRNMALIESGLEDPYVYKRETGRYELENIRQRETGRRPIKLEIMSNIMRFVKPAKKKKFLDIGCSSGDLLKIAGMKGFELFGLDVSKRVCKIAQKQNPKAKIFAGEVSEAKYQANYFDIINVSSVFYHLDDPNGFIKEIYRILKPGGILAIDEASFDHLLFLNRIYRLLFRKERNYKYATTLFSPRTFLKFIGKTKFKVLKLYCYSYSDKIVWQYIPLEFRQGIIIKALLKLNSTIKIDKIFGITRLFQAISIK